MPLSENKYKTNSGRESLPILFEFFVVSWKRINVHSAYSQTIFLNFNERFSSFLKLILLFYFYFMIIFISRMTSTRLRSSKQQVKYKVSSLYFELSQKIVIFLGSFNIFVVTILDSFIRCAIFYHLIVGAPLVIFGSFI